MSKPLLEARGLVKGYPSGGLYLPVLQGTDLDLAEAGEAETHNCLSIKFLT